MKIHLLHKKAAGFTLAELCVAMVLMGLFSTAAVASLNLTLRHWRTLSTQVDVNTACRTAMSVINAELRQATPCLSSGTLTYYYSGPSTATTVASAVITPNVRGQNSSTLVFTEGNPGVFDPLATGFSQSNGTYFRKVTYYTKNDGTLHRKVETLSSSGAGTLKSDDVICSSDKTTLTATCLGDQRFYVKVACSKTVNNDTKTAFLEANCLVLGE